MHYLTYVVGEDSDRTLERWKDVEWDWYVIGGRWGHLRRRARRRLPLPYNLVLSDGTWITAAGTNEQEMRKVFDALAPSERITIVDLHN